MTEYVFFIQCVLNLLKHCLRVDHEVYVNLPSFCALDLHAFEVGTMAAAFVIFGDPFKALTIAVAASATASPSDSLLLPFCVALLVEPVIRGIIIRRFIVVFMAFHMNKFGP